MTESKHFLLGAGSMLLAACLVFIGWPYKKAELEPVDETNVVESAYFYTNTLTNENWTALDIRSGRTPARPAAELAPIAEVVIERLDKRSFLFHIASEQGISYVESFKKYFTPVTALSFSKYDPLKPPAIIRLDVMANYDPDLLFQELTNAPFVKAK